MSGTFTRGVVFVHSAPRALCPHIEWAVSTILDQRVTMDWTDQPAVASLVRAPVPTWETHEYSARTRLATAGWSVQSIVTRWSRMVLTAHSMCGHSARGAECTKTTPRVKVPLISTPGCEVRLPQRPHHPESHDCSY